MSDLELLKVACEIEKYCREQSCGVLASPPQGIVKILERAFPVAPVWISVKDQEPPITKDEAT